MKETKKSSNTHSHHLSNFLGALKVAQQKKKVSFNYKPASKFVISVAKALRDEGYITGYTLNYDERRLCTINVLLKYYPVSFEPLVRFLKTFASPSRQYNLSYKSLFKLVRSTAGARYFLSTPFGILTSEQCLSKAIGGNLLLRIR